MSRLLAALYPYGVNRPLLTSEAANVIGPGHRMKAQGAALAASKILPARSPAPRPLDTALFRLAPELKVYLHRDAVDLRKNINGLCALVEQTMALDPFDAAIFAFSNRRRDRIKLLLWDRTGFWLLLKRLNAEYRH